ncbi:hypothetical protein BY996DRAFT_7254422 [Phakopsora pachyrhizi]|nr:hypothetical protein BY996DRAFT_7254422 [Phakopsora pachyrhizi]
MKMMMKFNNKRIETITNTLKRMSMTNERRTFSTKIIDLNLNRNGSQPHENLPMRNLRPLLSSFLTTQRSIHTTNFLSLSYNSLSSISRKNDLLDQIKKINHNHRISSMKYQIGYEKITILRIPMLLKKFYSIETKNVEHQLSDHEKAEQKVMTIDSKAQKEESLCVGDDVESDLAGGRTRLGPNGGKLLSDSMVENLFRSFSQFKPQKRIVLRSKVIRLQRMKRLKKNKGKI